MKILVVDDSKAMRMIVKRTLRQAGFTDIEVTEAENGVEAFESIQASKPDLVLSDWNMPEMTGIELLQKLGAENIDVPFGFVTTEGTAEMRDLAKQGGALFLIAKPFTPEDFKKSLGALVG